MASTTIELRNVLTMKNFELFDFDYGIIDLSWKEHFEKCFIDYYYFNEIGSETIDRWKHTLKTKLNMIMPYYNDLYKTTLMDIDPLLTQRIEESIIDNVDVTNTNTNKQTSQDDATSTNSDYPQTSNPSEDIPSNRVQTGSTGSVDINNTGEGKTIRDYSRIIEGFQGNQADLLRSYRANIINVTELLINELKTLFILVY